VAARARFEPPGFRPEAPVGYNRSVLLAETVLFLGDNLMAWIVLAMGGALAVGTGVALARPPEKRGDRDLERPPLLRSLVMIAVGTVAAIWALASLVSS